MLSPLRQGRVTGSQAGAILGLSPYQSREDVMNDWLYGSTFEGNVATEHGKFYEEYARADLEKYLNQPLVENTHFYISPDHNWLGATPDIVADDFVGEIKCPYSKRNAESEDDFKSIDEQSHYYAQVQIEMFCVQKELVYLMQWAPTGVYRVEKVKPDPVWLAWALPILEKFVAEYKERRASLTDDEHMAATYKALKATFEAAKKELDDHKAAMIARANGTKRKFADVLVYPVERKGSIPYAKVVKELLPDEDLEPWRGEPSTSWVVK